MFSGVFDCCSYEGAENSLGFSFYKLKVWLVDICPEDTAPFTPMLIPPPLISFSTHIGCKHCFLVLLSLQSVHFVFLSDPLALFLLSTCIKVIMNNHAIESILGSVKSPPPKKITYYFFSLVSGKFLGKRGYNYF